LSFARRILWPARYSLRKIKQLIGLRGFPKGAVKLKIEPERNLLNAHHRIGTYLAGILGLCALLHVPAYGDVGGDMSLSIAFSAQSQTPPPENQNPSSAEPQPGQSKTDNIQPTPQDQPTQEKPYPSASEPAKPNAAEKKPASGAPAKKSAKKKTHRAQPTGDEPQKRVVHRGGTVEPITQLAPGLTDEQAAKQRQNTNQLLASTDAALQKLSGRQLTKDEQDTVLQIRHFMQQAKTADATGDLPRAYKLAVKARLLSDALAKP
jgi:outer membrane biosynthesis protein TonB